MKSSAPSSPSIVRILLVRLRFLFVFVAIGLLVANWDRLMSLADRLFPPPEAAAPAGDFEWFCPMHPSIIRTAPSNCPSCGMPLVRRRKGTASEPPSGALSRIQLSPYRIRQGGVTTEEIQFRPLVRELRTVGFIEYDDRHVTVLSARIAGRVDKLLVDFEGSRVREGDALYEIYSPDLVTTQEEFLLAAKALAEVSSRPQHDQEALTRAQSVTDATRARLRLWGITDAQVAELEKSGKSQDRITIHSPASGLVVGKRIRAGDYLRAGDVPFTVVDDSEVWMQAEVFERDIGLVAEGQAVEILCEAYPGAPFRGKVSFIRPQVDPATRTVRARVEVDNRDLRLRAGMYVTATLRIPIGKVEMGGAAPPSESPPAGGEHAHEATTPATATGGEHAHGAPTGATAAAGEHAHEAPDVAPRKVYVCPMHKDLVLDHPGNCERCGAMALEEKVLPPGARLVYSCPDHPEHEQDKPGKCPVDGKDLEYKIVAAASRTVTGWACPVHLDATFPESGKCPSCGQEMVAVKRENVLAVPFAAVIDSGNTKAVFVERSSGVFDAVAVQLGQRAGDYYQVLQGLQPGDRVVSAGAFLLDAEARLNPAAGAAYFGAQGHEGHR